MSVLLKNALYIDWDTLAISHRNILADGNNSRLKFIDDADIPATTAGEIIDCAGRYVTRAFGTGHHHAYSALSRGMGAPKKQPSDFHEILKYVWWTLDKSLDADMIEASALVTAIASARAGSTFVIDHHASPYAVNGSLEIIAKAFEKIGVSHLLCYEISDRDGMEISGQGLEESANYLKDHQGLVGLHASFTVGNETLAKAVKLMNDTDSGIHIHVAEDIFDQESCQKEHGKRVVNRLYDAGALNSSKTILAHCLHINDEEKDIISSSPCWVVQNCESNLNNNVGYFNGTGLGGNIILGTDGMHSDMLQSAKASFFVGQRYDNISYEMAYRRFRNVHRYLHENKYSGDGENNLVILDYDPPTPLTRDNFFGHFLFGIDSSCITDVISNGRLIIRNRVLVTADEAEIMHHAREQALRLWKRMADACYY